MTTETEQVYHNQMHDFFTKQADKIAGETGFVQRSRKISGSLFLQALVWTVYHHAVITLGALAGVAEDLDPCCDATEQAFQERFTPEAVAFLQAMLAQALQQRVPQPAVVRPLLAVFAAVYILDSSTVSLPETMKAMFAGTGGDASVAAVKLYWLMDWLQGQCQAIELRDGRKADQDMGATFVPGSKPGALWLFDLGLWQLAFLLAIAEAASYFLCRLQPGVALSVPGSSGGAERLDLDQLLRQMKSEGAVEIDVLVGATALLPVRLICAKVPQQVANERRRRARRLAKRRGRTPKQKFLRRLDWVLLVTNAPCGMIPTTTVTIYRVRWQVELTFKLAKSDAGLDTTTSTKPSRVLCEFYAKLIALLWFEPLVALANRHAADDLSPSKAWRRLGDKLLAWGRHLRQGTGLNLLHELVDFLARRAKKSRRKKYPSTIQHLGRAATEAQCCCLIDPLLFLTLKRQGHLVTLADFCTQSPLAHRVAA
jgi:hypothetical protein